MADSDSTRPAEIAYLCEQPILHTDKTARQIHIGFV